MITTSESAIAARIPSVVASGSSGSRRAGVVTAPARRARPVSIGALELWISPGPSGSPGARSSSPVHSTETRGRRVAVTEPTPAAAAAPSATGPRGVPALSTTVWARMSSPAPRMCSPGSAAALVWIASPPLRSMFSWGMTAVAPGGTAAPVEMRIASPSARRWCEGVPARDSPTICSVRPASPAITA